PASSPIAPPPKICSRHSSARLAASVTAAVATRSASAACRSTGRGPAPPVNIRRCTANSPTERARPVYVEGDGLRTQSARDRVGGWRGQAPPAVDERPCEAGGPLRRHVSTDRLR